MPFYSLPVKAQLTYTFQNDIAVTEDNILLAQPFSGGFIAPQYSIIDLNLDGINDLFIFDRSSGKISTFLFLEEKYVHAPHYESFFPTGLKNWALLRDYNCDGKMDLFTSSIFGMSLHENTSVDKLKFVLKPQTIFTEGSNGQTNLQVSGLDLPAIIDVDNDGDIDILNFNFATGGGIEFHKNMSVENTGLCDLELVRTTKRYGDFEECTCETYVFGTNECPTGGREEHSGGKSLLSLYHSSNVTQDLLIGQENCLLPGYLPNIGTINLAKMNSVSFDFPDVNQPLRMEYPAFYQVDLYNNGSDDLIATPNSYVADGTQKYELLSNLYQKDSQGKYSLITDSFLKDEMIDIGHKAAPVFTDLDFDGDEDLLIGTGKNGIGATIWMYENTGSLTSPSFKLETKDFIGLKEEGLESLKLQIFDVNKDGLPDLVIFKIVNNQLISEAFLHSGNPIKPYSKANMLTLSLPELTTWDTPYYFKLGFQTGLLIGKQAGNLEYYTTKDNLTAANWVKISASYLDIEVDFNKRNLRIIVADFNANGTNDMLSVNDSREILVYDNFLDENNPQIIKGIVENTNTSFNLNFGNLAIPTSANLFGTLEPTIAFGLLQGGLQILKNTEGTDGGNKLNFKVIVYPNPVEIHQVLIQTNKNAKVRVLDAAGKIVVKQFNAVAGEELELQLLLEKGIYFIEATTDKKEKNTTRIVILN